jgi:imidazolonepropionase-like amidohydrolase
MRRFTSALSFALTCGLAVGLPVTSSAQATPAPAPDAATYAGPVAREGDIVILGGRLWDGIGPRSRPNRGILVRDGTILQVGLPPDMDTAPAQVLQLDDHAFIMPGLFDLHAHYAVDLFGDGRVDEYRVNPVLFLANGVTSTFPAGEVDPTEARKGRERIASGEIPGPRVFTSGPYFGTARYGWKPDAMTPDSVKKEVEHWAAQGVRQFKAKGIRPEQLQALITEAHSQDATVTGHLGSGFRGTVNPRDAILMGIDRIEHFLGGDELPDSVSAYASLEYLNLDDPTTRAQVEKEIHLFVEHHTYFDATLTAYGYYGDREPAVFKYWADEMGFLTPYARQVVESHLPRPVNEQFTRIYYVKRRTVKMFYEDGGADLLTLGTDHPSWGEFWSGFGAHRELQAMVLAGIPPVAALRAATINAARALGVDQRLGSVEAGKYADLLIVGGDPLSDITATRHALYVIKAGKVYHPAELFESVKGKMGPTSEAEADWWKGNVRLGGG